MFNDPIEVNDVIVNPPISPVDPGWYLISLHGTLYDNTVLLSIGTSLVTAGTSIVSESGAVGVVVSATGDDPQLAVVKYNGDDFIEGDLVEIGTTYQGTNGEPILCGTSTMKSNFRSFSGALAYYASGETSEWRYLAPFNDLTILYAGSKYVMRNIESSDQRWKLTEKIYSLTNYDSVTVGTTNLVVAASKNVSGYNSGCYQFTTVSLGTSLVMRVEGSNDGTSWFNVESSDTTATTDATTYTINFTNKFLYTRLLAVDPTEDAPSLVGLSLLLTNY
jgi:hypothetical protein